MQLPRPTPRKRNGDWVLQLINIVFLCLLFFLVTGTITSQQVQQILPPATALTGAGGPPGDAIFIHSSGALSFRGAPATLQEVSTQLRGATGDKHAVEIVADRTLSAARLVDVLSELRRLGVGDISLITVTERGR